MSQNETNSLENKKPLKLSDKARSISGYLSNIGKDEDNEERKKHITKILKEIEYPFKDDVSLNLFQLDAFLIRAVYETGYDKNYERNKMYQDLALMFFGLLDGYAYSNNKKEERQERFIIETRYVEHLAKGKDKILRICDKDRRDAQVRSMEKTAGTWRDKTACYMESLKENGIDIEQYVKDASLNYVRKVNGKPFIKLPKPQLPHSTLPLSFPILVEEYAKLILSKIDSIVISKKSDAANTIKIVGIALLFTSTIFSTYELGTISTSLKTVSSKSPAPLMQTGYYKYDEGSNEVQIEGNPNPVSDNRQPTTDDDWDSTSANFCPDPISKL